MARCQRRPQLALGGDEPARDAAEARPPEGPHAGTRQHRTEISKAQYPGSRLQRQDELVPDMPCPELRQVDANFRKDGCSRDTRRQRKPQFRQLRHIALGRQDLIKRGDDFVGVALNAGHALGQKATIDGPASPSLHVIVGNFHD